MSTGGSPFSRTNERTARRMASLLLGSACLTILAGAENSRPAAAPALRLDTRHSAPVAPSGPTPVAVPLAEAFAPQLVIELPPAEIVQVAAPARPVAPPAPQSAAVTIVPRAVAVIDIPAAPKVPDAPARRAQFALFRPADGASSPVRIDQLSDPAQSAQPMAQLHEPGVLAPVALNERIAAMQVTVPGPIELSAAQRAELLAGSPDTLAVRMGDQAIGEVAFRMTDARIITVQLSGLLDLVGPQLDPDQFGRLRNSSAAEQFVPLDQLRAAGIGVHYDPVYDELRMTG